MKRSEFVKIVNAVELEESQRLVEVIKGIAREKKPESLSNALAVLAGEISRVSARTTAEILIRSGIVQVDDPADDLPSSEETNPH